MYPFFLRVQTPPRDEAARAPAAGRRPPFLENRHGVLVAVFLAFAAIVSAGLWKLDTSPSLSSYFAAGSTLRTSLDYVDRHGGSVPLELVVANPNGAPLRVGDDYQRLWRLQHQLERDPSVGSVMSLTLLLAEGKRPWYASFVPTGWVLRTLEGPRFGRVARYFVTKSHTRALFALRMRDSYRAVEPLENVARLERMVRLEGFKPVQVGGIYVLYSRLSVLVGKSLFEGLMLLLLAFAIMGAIIARSLRVGAAVLVGLSAVPVTMLGVLGLLHVPVDMISAPGANIAIGIGVDALIHTLVWVRRYPAASMGSWEAWSAVCKRLWKPILYSTSIVCAGFAMVLLGTLLAPLPAVLVVPWLATDRPPAYRAPWARRAYALGAK
jgi:predicted RND superfamily exporter protein